MYPKWVISGQYQYVYKSFEFHNTHTPATLKTTRGSKFSNNPTSIRPVHVLFPYFHLRASLLVDYVEIVRSTRRVPTSDNFTRLAEHLRIYR